MTMHDLEKENKFLKLQLKLIGNLFKDVSKMNDSQLHQNIGAVIYTTKHYKEEFNFIKERDLPYNFFNENMSV